jgi:hypothetical protein
MAEFFLLGDIRSAAAAADARRGHQPLRLVLPPAVEKQPAHRFRCPRSKQRYQILPCGQRLILIRIPYRHQIPLLPSAKTEAHIPLNPQLNPPSAALPLHAPLEIWFSFSQTSQLPHTATPVSSFQSPLSSPTSPQTRPNYASLNAPTHPIAALT